MGNWVVTSAWPYTSEVPHLGNLIGSVLSADVHARFLRMNGQSVIFVSGSDEHGTPVEIEAMKRKTPVSDYTDQNHLRISEIFKKWNISYDNYTRTGSPVHLRFVREHYLEIFKNGYVFDGEERLHYCPKDKKSLPDRFVEGICPNCSAPGARGDQCDVCDKPLDAISLISPHCIICNGSTELRTTKQWFFDLPKLSEQIKEYLSNNRYLAENAVRFSLSLIEEGLRPRSLTRDTSWGIPSPFPGSEDKTIYVWMEAVLGYLSATIEYFERIDDKDRWKEYWQNSETKTSFFIGKDNIPFHTIILTGLLLASNRKYTLPKIISSTEFLQFEGKKFSKSHRVGIWADEALDLLPLDYWRYTLLSVRPESGDVNFTYDLLEEKVNTELNDKIGNFVHRTFVAIKRFQEGIIVNQPPLNETAEKILAKIATRHREIRKSYELIRIQRAVKLTLEQAEEGNRYLNSVEPWRSFNDDPVGARSCLYVCARIIKNLGVELLPIIPSSASTILKYLGLNNGANWDETDSDFPFPLQITSFKPLFSKIKKEEIITKLQKLRAGRESQG